MEIKLEPYKHNKALKERISNGKDICLGCGATNVELRIWFIDQQNNKQYYPKLNKLTVVVELCIKCFPTNFQTTEKDAAKIIIPLLENKL